MKMTKTGSAMPNLAATLADRLALPADCHLEPIANDCALLTGALDAPAKEGRWEGLAIPGLSRRMALALHTLFLSSPSWSDRLEDIPDQCQFLLWEEADGCGTLVPILDGGFRAWLCGDGAGLALATTCGPGGEAQKRVALAIAAFGADPYETIRRGMQTAIEWMGRGRPRTEKPVPAWVDRFGWNTWDAFYTKLDEEKMLAGLEAFRAAGFMPGQMVIDEGWQDYSDDGFLTSYGVKKGAFTDEALTTFVRAAKEEYGIEEIGCWHTLFGEMRGIDPQAPAFADLAPRRLIELDTEADPFGVPRMDRVGTFFQTYHQRLAAQGIDFVKVDFQSALFRMTYDEAGRAEAARRWQYALQDAVGAHFGGEILNCMCLSSDQTYHTRDSNVSRASDDYFPGKPQSHPPHLRQNAFNALWLENCVLPDWDMFHSLHPWGRYHALARAISGGPVYVSDKPGESDIPLLRQLVAADGKTLRADEPARPTRDILFEDPAESGRLLKVFTHCGAIGVLGVFHPRPAEDGEPITEEVAATLVESIAGDRFAVYSVHTGFRGFFGADEALEVCLAPGEADALVFSPVTDGIAPLGLVEKLNPAAAVLGCTRDGDAFRVDTRGGGAFAVAIDGTVASVERDGVPVAFEQEGPLCTVPTGEAPGATITLRLTA
jgi:raffinose synthase